jgi:hypothetical protein
MVCLRNSEMHEPLKYRQRQGFVGYQLLLILMLMLQQVRML